MQHRDDAVGRRAAQNLEPSRLSRKRQRDEEMVQRVKEILTACEAEVLREYPSAEAEVRDFRQGVDAALGEPSGPGDLERNASVLNATAASRARETLFRAKARAFATQKRDHVPEPRQIPIDKEDVRRRAQAIREAAPAAADVTARAPAQLTDLETLIDTVQDLPIERPPRPSSPSTRVAGHLSQLESLARFLH